MRVVTGGLALLIAGAAFPALAQAQQRVAEQTAARGAALVRLADCAVRGQPALAAAYVADGGERWPAPLFLQVKHCISADRKAGRLQVQGFVSRGVFGMAFVRHPEWLPASLSIKPLQDKPTDGNAIVETVAACIVAEDPAGARRLADALAGQPEEQSAYAGIADLASRCVAPWPDVAINGPMLRAGLGIALFRAAASAKVSAGVGQPVGNRP